MLWFMIGLILGLFIGIRDKILDMKALSDKIIKGEVIQIGNGFYKANKIERKEN